MTHLARYKAALAGLFLAWPALGLAEKVAGAVIPDESRQVAERRYRIDKSYEDTLKFFRSVYPPAKFPRKPIPANKPGVRAVHIENPDPKPGSWDGLNVYEINGETRVFVLVAPGDPKKPKKG
ncbi:MAG TPA: hypothetical protein VFR85_10480 [Anaeromyxobacteraceae bacterium]|nr:hypothetical protein [Anaeromyxobacteraceae bacterium]